MDLRLQLLTVSGRPARAERRLTADRPALLGRSPHSAPPERVPDGVPERVPDDVQQHVVVGLADEAVAPQHCRLEPRPSRTWSGAPAWWVSELPGSPGLLLNGQRLVAPRQLRGGDLLRLGRTCLRIELGPARRPTPCAGCGTPPELAGEAGLSQGRRWVCGACARGERRQVRRVGAWVEVTELSMGSHGAVLLCARDEQQLAAVKLASSDPFGDPTEQETLELRFWREVDVLRRLDDPSVVRAYEAGQCEYGHWVAMELMEQDLERVVRRHGPLHPVHAASLAADLLRGLEHIHARGVLHRDLKPQNVLVSGDGSVRLGDFGLCSSLGSPTLTEEHLGLGTLHFASPEQIEDAHRVDARTDLFGWGATLYYLLTGRAPFWWLHAFQDLVRAQLEEQTPRPDQLDPQVPAPLADVVMRALEPEPERRFAQAGEALLALEGAIALLHEG